MLTQPSILADKNAYNMLRTAKSKQNYGHKSWDYTIKALTLIKFKASDRVMLHLGFIKVQSQSSRDVSHMPAGNSPNNGGWHDGRLPFLSLPKTGSSVSKQQRRQDRNKPLIEGRGGAWLIKDDQFGLYQSSWKGMVNLQFKSFEKGRYQFTHSQRKLLQFSSPPTIKPRGSIWVAPLESLKDSSSSEGRRSPWLILTREVGPKRPQDFNRVVMTNIYFNLLSVCAINFNLKPKVAFMQSQEVRTTTAPEIIGGFEVLQKPGQLGKSIVQNIALHVR